MVLNELKSLCVIIDSRLTLDAHIAAVSKSCNYHIWALRNIRHLCRRTLCRCSPAALWAPILITVMLCCTKLQSLQLRTMMCLQCKHIIGEPAIRNSLASVILQQPGQTD